MRPATAMIIAFLCMACINTSYSRIDEKEITNSEVHLIIGQFAHHGEAFYKSELKRTKEILAKNDKDFEARNDLASAYIKLAEYDLAETEFKKNEELYPGKYKTAANLGVLYKKAGRYSEAAENLARSLKIKPEGHMGLGDYYQKMIEWLRDNDKNSVPEANFLGVKYTESPDPNVTNYANKTYLLTLIKNDYKFADTYLVLGDWYYAEKDYQLALRAYYRALKSLKHPNREVLYNRMSAIYSGWNDEMTDKHVIERDKGDQQLREEIEDAKEWLKEFQSIESLRLANGEAVDFRSMKKALKDHGLEKVKVVEAGFFKGREKGKFKLENLILPVIGIILLLGILKIVSDSLKPAKRKS